MNRYLIIVLLFLATHVFAQQNSYNKSYKKIDLFSKFDEILLSSMNLRITAASTPIVSATSFEKERLSDST